MTNGSYNSGEHFPFSQMAFQQTMTWQGRTRASQLGGKWRWRWLTMTPLSVFTHSGVCVCTETAQKQRHIQVMARWRRVMSSRRGDVCGRCFVRWWEHRLWGNTITWYVRKRTADVLARFFVKVELRQGTVAQYECLVQMSINFFLLCILLNFKESWWLSVSFHGSFDISPFIADIFTCQFIDFQNSTRISASHELLKEVVKFRSQFAGNHDVRV